MLGPISPASLADANSAIELEQLAIPFVSRRLPEVGDEDLSQRWRRCQSFDAGPGIYLLALPLTFRETGDVILSVEESPGGGLFWFDRTDRLAVQIERLWDKAGQVHVRRKLGKQYRGGHRLIAVVCVPDISLPLTLRLLDSETQEPAPGVFVDIR
jgi:hypothetical protein